MKKNYEISPFGATAIRMSWKPVISVRQSEEILAVDAVLHAEWNAYIQETHFGYHELVIHLRDNITPQTAIEKLLRFLQEKRPKMKTIDKAIYTIPVCYNTDMGWDLEALCQHHKISQSELIALHTKPIYPIHFIGFLPGFPYLGGLDKRIATPRKENPRPRILAGAVGIAGMQTGIYPINSPGGWNIIGNTPISLFDPKLENPALLKAGNFIRFTAIGLSEYEDIKQQVEQGKYVLEKSKHE